MSSVQAQRGTSGGPGESGSGSRGLKIAAGFLVGLIVLLLGLYLADVAFNRGNVPRGTAVGGVGVGGMAPAEAVDKLSAELGGVNDDPVTVAAGEKTTEFVPASAGLGPDWQATIDAAGTESLNPVTRLMGLFRTTEVDIVSTADEAALAPTVERVAKDLTVEPVDGTVAIKDGKADVKDPQTGQNIPADELKRAMTSNWLNPDGVEVEPDITDPAIDEKLVKDTVDGPVARALDGPLTLKGRDDTDAVIDSDRIGEVVTFRNDPGQRRIVPEVDSEAAQGILAEQLKDTVKEGKNATISASGEVTPSVDGIEIRWDETMKGFGDRVLGDESRTWDADYRDTPATFTTEQAESATFNDVVGEFTTGGYSSASGTNISIVAHTVDGAVVSPGETFSLNGYTGPRGTAQGYVSSGIIIDGRAGNAVGGGISQFATTLYNASYFAGMTDVDHTPHSYYISRYPAGREATVYEGAIDLAFKNDTPHPVKIETSFGGGEITVRFKGVKDREVESVNGGRWAYTSPSPKSVSGGECIPSGGAQGFTTSDTRIVRNLSGNEISRETQTTVYNPQPIVQCG
ncbi:VanW family protein [Corynebacterium appendicis]|uniref:VanW family protein n=1 Tax=Corynebacterium appendicis TaxID=163202 RepID=UPI00254E8454|nr:VanW family protein [Corynebacterium appendicis]MDK8626438.1 VanW family protein [Corynebacterium appendicis]